MRIQNKVSRIIPPLVPIAFARSGWVKVFSQAIPAGGSDRLRSGNGLGQLTGCEACEAEAFRDLVGAGKIFP